MKKYFILIMILSLSWQSQAQSQKRLYLANDDHTDYMWTANEAKYDSAFVQMLDYYLFQIDATKNNPPDFQARFNCDGNFWLKAYEKYHSPAKFNLLMAAIRSGHISSPLNMLVSCYGAQPAEAVIRGMLYAGQLERKYNLRFTMAVSMENNTLPLGLASLWAGAGAKYSWKGIGGYGSQMSYAMRANRRYQMYRYTGLDSARLLMKWYAYNEKKNAPLGSYAECRLRLKYKDLDADLGNVVKMLDAFCDTVSPNSTYPYLVAGAFGFGHDDLSTFQSQPFINAARSSTNKNTQVRVSNESDFFEDFERSYPSLPSQSVSFGNEWDVLPASMNETTARVKRATEKLRAAEALAAVVSLNNKTIMDGLDVARNQAWESYGVYWEHNWTADGPVSRKARAEWQIKQQQHLTDYVDTLYNRAEYILGTQIKKAGGTSFYVFNTLGWARSEVADILFDGNYSVKVVDRSTKKEVACQLVQIAGKQYLRILADSIPAVGYKVFEIKTGRPATLPPAAKVNGNFFSNQFYRLRLNASGAIMQLFDSSAGSRQLVAEADGRFLNDLGSGNVVDNGSPLIAENEGPVSVTLKAVSPNPVPHTVRVTLFSNSPCIQIEDSIQANFGDVKTWSFSFGLQKQTTRHEELGAILTVKKESHGGHYADQNARYDWQTFNHFVDLSEACYGVTLSNSDCSFFKLGKSSVDSLWESSPQINALAGGNVDKKLEDKGILGILNQNGQTDFLYRFALTTHQNGFDAVKAMQFSLSQQNPLVTGIVTGAKKTLPDSSFSFIQISDEHILLWALKPAEDGIKKGLVARFWNMANTSNDQVIHFPKSIKAAWKVSHIETNKKQLRPIKGNLGIHFNQHQMNTYRLVF